MVLIILTAEHTDAPEGPAPGKDRAEPPSQPPGPQKAPAVPMGSHVLHRSLPPCITCAL